MLSRVVRWGGLLGTRPVLALRFRADQVPALPARIAHVQCSFYDLPWPADWRAIFERLDRAGWKYVHIWPSLRHVDVHLIGYANSSVRRLLPSAASAIAELQARGVRVNVLTGGRT